MGLINFHRRRILLAKVLAPAINLQATSVESDAVELLWENGEHHSSVQVQRREGTGNWANISTALSVSTTTFADLTVAPSTPYVFRIKSSNASGSVYSEPITVETPSGIAPVPPNIRAENITNNSATILWDVVQDAVSYRIRYKKATVTGWITGNAVSHPTNSVDISSLEPEVTYQIQLRSENSFGNSVWSTSFEFETLLGLPNPATNLHFTKIETESFVLNWVNNGGQTSVFVQQMDANGNWQNITSALDGNTETHDISQRTPSTEYTFRIRSVNSAGTVYSSAESVITEQGIADTPNNLRHSNLTSNSVRVLWDSVDDADEYVVRYKKSIDTSWSTGPWATSIFKDFSNLTPDTSYQFAVKSRNIYGESVWSPFIQITTVAATGIVLSSSSHDYKSISLAWTKPYDVTGYRLHMTKAGVSHGYVYPTAEKTVYTYTELDPDTFYEFYIEAQNSSGVWYGTSNTVNVQTNSFPTSLAASPSFINLGQPANDIKVELLSNSTWSVTSSPAWVSFSGLSGNGDDIFTVQYEANNSGAERTGEIVITEGGSGSTVSIQLIQENEAVVVVTPPAEWDVDYQEVLNVATANGFPHPDDAQKIEDNNDIINLKSTKVWDKIGYCLKTEGTAVPLFKLIDWKRKLVLPTYGSLNWLSTGVQNGGNGYINSLFIPSQENNWELNNAFMITIFSEFINSGQRSAGGGYNGSAAEYVNFGIPHGGNSTLIALNGYSSQPNATLPSSGKAFMSIGRGIADQVEVNHETGSFTLAQNSSGLLTKPIYLLARARHDQGATAADLFHTGTVRFMIGGLNMQTEAPGIKKALTR